MADNDSLSNLGRDAENILFFIGLIYLFLRLLQLVVFILDLTFKGIWWVGSKFMSLMDFIVTSGDKE